MAARGLLISVEPPPSLFDDLIKGFDRTWFVQNSSPEFPMSPLRSPQEWREQLKLAGFAEATAEQAALGYSRGIIVLARKGESPAIHRDENRTMCLIVDGAQQPSAIATSLAGFLALRGISVALDEDNQLANEVGCYDDI